jgi:hypothetical protein
VDWGRQHEPTFLPLESHSDDPLEPGERSAAVTKHTAVVDMAGDHRTVGAYEAACKIMHLQPPNERSSDDGEGRPDLRENLGIYILELTQITPSIPHRPSHASRSRARSAAQDRRLIERAPP